LLNSQKPPRQTLTQELYLNLDAVTRRSNLRLDHRASRI